MIKAENQAVGAAAARVARKRETVHPESEGKEPLDISLKDAALLICGAAVIVALFKLLGSKSTKGARA